MKRNKFGAKPEPTRPVKSLTFDSDDLFRSAVLVEIKRDSEYLYVGVSKTDLMKYIAALKFFNPLSISGAKMTLTFFDNKDDALEIKRQLVNQYQPAYNGKVGRRGEAEKKETGLTKEERTKEEVSADRLINLALGKQADKKKASNVDEILGMDLDELLKDLDFPED